MAKAKMTRAHFKLIAETIGGDLEMTRKNTKWIAERFADNLRSTNPNFQRARFMEYVQKCYEDKHPTKEIV